MSDTWQEARNRHLAEAAAAFLAVAAAPAYYITYEGSGDSGGIETAVAVLETDKSLAAAPKCLAADGPAEYSDDVPHEVYVLADALVDFLYGGWENGDGASGTLILYKDGKYYLKHITYFTDSETTTTEGTLNVPQ